MSEDIIIPYSPHEKQLEVHESEKRFRVVAAGRRGGKTTLAINDIVRSAVNTPNGRTWYIAPTYKQAKSVVWDDPKGIFHYLPAKFIKKILRTEQTIFCKNGHIIELKGAENKDKLRGVGLNFVVMDEFGQMEEDVWYSIVRPMLADKGGRALFIGTPHKGGGPHFEALYKLGQTGDPEHQSWLFFTKDNPHIPASEVENARRTLPPEEFKREWEADFTISEGLVYDNFDYGIHVIPSYEPGPDDLVVGSIDPGLVNETAAILTAWSKDGTGRVFKEYYQKEFLAYDNAEAIAALGKPYKVKYWVIDRATIRREPSGGASVYDIYSKYLRPLYCAKNDPGSVILGINEVKRLLQPHADTKQARLYICADMTNFINEIEHYTKYKPKFNTTLNAPDKPRKYRDHLMDCIKNVVMTKPWQFRGMEPHNYTKGLKTRYSSY